jgi:pilus assembly protein Flp/PilA
MNFIKKFMREEDGVTAIEYGLLAALIALIMAAGARVLGVSLSDLFRDIGTALDGVGRVIPAAPPA